MTKKDPQEQKLPPDVRGMNKTVRAMYNSSAMGFVYNDLIRSYHGLKKYSKQIDKSVYRSVSQIQEQLDWMDRRDIRRCVKKLVDDGWIKVTKRAHGCMYILPGNKLPDYVSVASKTSLEVLSRIPKDDPEITKNDIESSKNQGTKCPPKTTKNNPQNGTKSGVSDPVEMGQSGVSDPVFPPIIKCNNNQVNICRDPIGSLQMASQRKQACTTPPLAGAQQAACLVQPPAELSPTQSARASLGQDSRRKTSFSSDVLRDASRHPAPQREKKEKQKEKGHSRPTCQPSRRETSRTVAQASARQDHAKRPAEGLDEERQRHVRPYEALRGRVCVPNPPRGCIIPPDGFELSLGRLRGSHGLSIQARQPTWDNRLEIRQDATGYESISQSPCRQCAT